MKAFSPSYLSLYSSGELENRKEQAFRILSSCTLCPWRCRVNRIAGERGQCQTSSVARIYSYMPHHGEEKPLRGRNGSGTIFFSGCNLHCVYCQNAEISQENYGMNVYAEKIAEMMLYLQEKGCHNINLVTPTHVVAQILEALLIAARDGLHLPLVYNSGGYESLDTLNLLEGIIDIYMPDMKYANLDTAYAFSGVRDYPIVNQTAIREMHHQVGDLLINHNGYAERGLIIRHLILPGHIKETYEILKFIRREISENAYVNIMGQYRPEFKAYDYPNLDRPLSETEYEQAIRLAHEVGLNRLDSYNKN